MCLTSLLLEYVSRLVLVCGSRPLAKVAQERPVQQNRRAIVPSTSSLVDPPYGSHTRLYTWHSKTYPLRVLSTFASSLSLKSSLDSSLVLQQRIRFLPCRSTQIDTNPGDKERQDLVSLLVHFIQFHFAGNDDSDQMLTPFRIISSFAVDELDLGVAIRVILAPVKVSGKVGKRGK